MLLHKSYAKQCTYVLFVSLVYFFMFLPMIGIFFHSFNTSSIASTWTGLTLDWYKALFKSPEIGKAAWHSLVIAIGSTTLSVILGTAFVLGTAEKKYSKLDALFYPNIFTPDIVLAVAIMSLFKFFSIPCGFVSLIAGHTAIGLVFTIPLLRSRMEELDKFLIEASLDLGADHWYTTKKVLLPLLKPAIVTAAFIAFTLSLDDFFISFFCAGNEIETLSMYIFSHLRTNNTPVLSALSICIVTISFTFLMVGYAITKYTTMERKNDTA